MSTQKNIFRKNKKMSQYVLKSASTGLGQAFPYHRSSEKKEASVDSRRDREEHMSKRLELRFKR